MQEIGATGKKSEAQHISVKHIHTFFPQIPNPREAQLEYLQEFILELVHPPRV